MNKKNKLILLAAYLVLLGIFLVLLLQNKYHQTNVGDLTVDFTQSLGTQKMVYGANENDNWKAFATDKIPKQLHQDVGSKVIRVFVADPPWRESTIPYGGDFTQLDSYVNAVLESDAIPFIVIAHEPRHATKTFGEPPPPDLALFTAYVTTIIQHYDTQCKQNKMSKPCDVNNWYLEIWNEPYTEEWWPDTYITLFNTVDTSVKAIVPGIKIGGPSLDYLHYKQETEQFIENTHADFVSIHHYGNTAKKNSNDIISLTQTTYFTSLQELSEFVLSKKDSLEIINSEYNYAFQSSYMTNLDEPYVASWYAEVLALQILSRAVDMELFYSGTSLQQDGGFGMWHKNDDAYNTWPTYWMKSQFVKANPTGSTLAYSTSSKTITVLANQDTKIITLINNNPIAETFTLTIKDQTVTAKTITLQPYTVTFMTI